MSVFDFLARHRLLLSLGLLSLLAHVAAITWVDLRFDPPRQAAGVALLNVRIAMDARPGAPAAPAAVPTPVPTPAPGAMPTAVPVTSAARNAPEERISSAPSPAAPDPVDAVTPTPLPPLISDAAATPAIADARPQEEEAFEQLGQMPTTYRSTPAQTVRIDYRVSLHEADAPARSDGDARLEWESRDSRYRLALDGVLGALHSEGGLDEAGIAPRRVVEPFGPGLATTLFDRQQRLIMSAIGAWRAPLVAGSQDTASVLMQLAAIGQSDPDQMQRDVTIWVGGAAGARAERYEVMARETIDTGIGALDTVRLARRGLPDAPLLEVWLAPGQGWLPVQLRLTGPDGAVRTQTVTAIAHAAPDGEAEARTEVN